MLENEAASRATRHHDTPRCHLSQATSMEAASKQFWIKQVFVLYRSASADVQDVWAYLILR